MTGAGRTVGPAGLLLAEAVRVSFQRCLCPPSGRHESPPSSLGALSVGEASEGKFLVPLADDEALWLGLEACGARPVRVWIAAEMEDGSVWNAVSGRTWEEDRDTHLATPPAYACDGIFLDKGVTRAFCRRTPAPGGLECRELRFEADCGSDEEGAGPVARSIQAQVALVDYATFCAGTGLPAPPALEGLTRYTGWRLP